MEQFNCKFVCVTVYQIQELTRTRDTFVWQGRLFRTSILLIFVFSHFYKLITYHGNLTLTVWRSISAFDARKIMCNHSIVDQNLPCKISLFSLQSFNYKAPAHFWLCTWSNSDIETIIMCHVICLIQQIFVNSLINRNFINIWRKYSFGYIEYITRIRYRLAIS